MSNFVLVVITLGLFIPWAAVRIRQISIGIGAIAARRRFAGIRGGRTRGCRRYRRRGRHRLRFRYLAVARRAVVEANFFDGRSTRIRMVNLSVDGKSIVIAGDGMDLRLPIAEIKVDERLGRAPRRLRLKDGSFCEVRDLDGTRRLLLASVGHRDGRVDRLQRQAKYVLIACARVLDACRRVVEVGTAMGGGARRPSPAACRRAAPFRCKPSSSWTDKFCCRARFLERRQRLEEKFHALLLPDGGTAASALFFRRSPQLEPMPLPCRMGPSSFSTTSST